MTPPCPRLVAWLLILWWPLHAAALVAGPVRAVGHIHLDSPVLAKHRGVSADAHDCARTREHYGITPLRCLGRAAAGHDAGHHHDDIGHHRHAGDPSAVLAVDPRDDRDAEGPAKRSGGGLDALTRVSARMPACERTGPTPATTHARPASRTCEPPERPPR